MRSYQQLGRWDELHGPQGVLLPWTTLMLACSFNNRNDIGINDSGNISLGGQWSNKYALEPKTLSVRMHFYNSNKVQWKIDS